MRSEIVRIADYTIKPGQTKYVINANQKKPNNLYGACSRIAALNRELGDKEISLGSLSTFFQDVRLIHAGIDSGELVSFKRDKFDQYPKPALYTILFLLPYVSKEVFPERDIVVEKVADLLGNIEDRVEA